MIFTYSLWTGLPIHVRIKLAADLEIKKTGPTHVVSDNIQSDGYRIQDIEQALTEGRLREYTGSESKDLRELFDLAVAKATAK